MHAAVVTGAGESDAVVIGIAERCRVDHRTDALQANAARRPHGILGNEEVGLPQPGANRLIEELDARAHDVGERFVERTGLVQVDQIRCGLGDPVRQFVRGHVKRTGEVTPVLPRTHKRAVRWKPVTEIHHTDTSGTAGAAPERVDDKQPKEVIRDRIGSVFASEPVDERQDRTVAIVQTTAAVAFEVVVVGPPDIGVRVDGREVGPHVIGISRQIRWKQWRTAEHDIDRAVEIAAHVISRQHWWPQAIVSDEASSLTSD